MEPYWIRVKVHTGARKEMLVELGPGRLEAWVKAKPIEGRANEAVVNLLGQHLDVSTARIRLVKGHQSPHKLFEVVSL